MVPSIPLFGRVAFHTCVTRAGTRLEPAGSDFDDFVGR
jgi:hypothetical protein